MLVACCWQFECYWHLAHAYMLVHLAPVEDLARRPTRSLLLSNLKWGLKMKEFIKKNIDFFFQNQRKIFSKFKRLKCLRLITGGVLFIGIVGLVVGVDVCCAAGFVKTTSLIFNLTNAASMRGFTSAATISWPL